MFSHGRPSSTTLEEVLKSVSEADILSYYLNIPSIPCVIPSPLRQDKNPSFGLYSLDGQRIYYKDFATQERGGTFQLLRRLWGLSFQETLDKIKSEMLDHKKIVPISRLNSTVTRICGSHNNSSLECKVREWRDYDLQYWESYGVTLPWLKYAEVYPISHKIVIKDGQRYVFQADKYAYAFVERKEGQVTLKIYQPLSEDKRYKWANKHDRSVVSLWTKIPDTGDKVCICSSLKDALCLYSNLGIPSIAIQGEGYGMSDTAVNELKRRFKKVYICLDSDNVGILDAEKLAARTGFINVVLPKIEDAKDISDIFKALGKEEFIKTIKPLFYDT